MFITFEGIDGSGKSTQIRLLRTYFESKNIDAHLFREPGGTELSEQIRSLLLHGGEEMDPVTELLLFSAARSQLISEKVLPLLETGKVVILDRFYDSTTAYQGYGRESAPLNQIDQLNKIASHNLVPDITFYLEVSPESAANRTAGAEKDRMERSGSHFFAKVAEGFRKLSQQEKRFVTINGEKDIEEIHKIIIRTVQQFS